MRMQLDWPLRSGNKPVTTALNQAILRAAAVAAREECPSQVAAFEQALESCQHWRNEYRTVMELLVHIQAAASPETVVNMCRAGLEFASSSFILRSLDGDGTSDATSATMTLTEAFAQSPDPLLETLTFVGPKTTDQEMRKFKLASPHGTHENPIWVTDGDALAQLKAWADYGCMEQSAVTHASAVCASNNVTEFVTDKIFCLLGITSEMGPTTHLLKIPHAHVMGVARAGVKLEALADWCTHHIAPGVTLQMAPANLLEQVPAIARWIIATAGGAPKASNGRSPTLVLMPLAYMDGEANVRVTVAMDAIVQYVMEHYTSGDVALAYLTSPTTIYTIPPDAAADAQRRYEAQQTSSLTWIRLAQTVSLRHWYQPSNTWRQLEGDGANHVPTKPVVYNGAHALQGPNYCLAKMMQQWRCIVERYGSRSTQVSAPHAPVTRTWSVLHNASAAKAIEGMQFFEPMITFDILPCSSLLTAIMLNQLMTKSNKDASNETKLHPLELFWDGSVHGVSKSGWCPNAALAPKPQCYPTDI